MKIIIDLDEFFDSINKNNNNSDSPIIFSRACAAAVNENGEVLGKIDNINCKYTIYNSPILNINVSGVTATLEEELRRLLHENSNSNKD